MSLDYVAYVNSEGGPLLCLDGRAAMQWKGADEGETDYENLCDVFNALPDSAEAALITVGGCPAVAWEMQGAGTADVFQSADGIIRIVRSWVDDDSLEESRRLARADAPSHLDITEISTPSRLLVIMWAPESGETIPPSIENTFEMVEDTATGNSIMVLKVGHDHYLCRHDRVELGASTARRLTLIPLTPTLSQTR